MRLDELQRKLLAAARADAPGDRVPFAFEKRIMAHLAGQSAPDTLTLWARSLWRATVPCLVAVVLISATSVFIPKAPIPAAGELATLSNTELSEELESTLLADLGQNVSDEEVW